MTTRAERTLFRVAHDNHSWHGPNDEEDLSKGYWVSPGRFLAALNAAGLSVENESERIRGCEVCESWKRRCYNQDAE